MGKSNNNTTGANYFFGAIVLLITVIGFVGSIYSSGLYAWLFLPALVLSIIFRKYKPKWLYIMCLIISILLTLYFFYGFVGSF